MKRNFVGITSAAALVLFGLAPAFADTATVTEAVGRIEIMSSGAPEWTRAATGQELPGGSQLRTGPDAEAVLAFPDGTKLRIGANSEFKVESAAPSRVALFMGLGRLEAWVKHVAGRQFQVRSPSAVASVRGTVFAFHVAHSGATRIDLFQGSLAINDSFGHPLSLSSGQTVRATTARGFSQPAALPASMSAPPAEPGVKMTINPAKSSGQPQQPNPAQQPANGAPPPDEIPALGIAPPMAPPSPQQNQIITCPQTVSPSSPCP